MGTISQKLEYLATTKTKIKDSINLTGAGLTTEPFRQYAIKLKDAYVDIINNGTDTLYNNFPKVSGSGTDLSLQNTYEAPMRSTLKGNTYQTYLSGINIFNIQNNSSLPTGVSIDNDDYISASYNNTGSSEHYQNVSANKTAQMQPSTNYLVVCEIKSVSGTGYLYPYTKHPNSGIDTDHTYYRFVDLSAGQIIVMNVKTKSDISNINNVLRTLVRYDAGQSGTIVFRLSLLTDLTITPTTFVYQKYVGGVPSPNPSYPQDIHNVSGNNSVVVYGKNIYNEDTSQSYKWLTYQGVIQDSTDPNIVSAFIKVKNGSQYVFSGIPTGTYTLRVCSYTGTTTSTFKTQLVSNLDNVRTFTADADYIVFAIGNADATILNNIQLEEGSTATTYEAYNGTTYPINLPVENLFDKDNANVLSAYINTSGVVVQDTQPSTLYIPCKPNTTYTITKPLQTTQSGNRFRYGCCSSIPTISTQLSKFVALSGGTTETIQTFTTDSTAQYLVLNYAGGSIGEYQAVINGIQIEYGTKSNTYTPYGTTPIELCKIGTYQDNFLRNSGKNLIVPFSYTREHNGITFTYLLDGSINLNGTSTGTAFAIANADVSTYTKLPVGTYTLSGGISDVLLRFDDNTGTNVANTSSSTQFTINSEMNCYIQLRIPSGKTFNNVKIYPMINEGRTALPFEPYGNGEWYLHKETGKKVASDFTSSSITTTSQGFYFNPNSTNVMANRALKIFSKTQTWKNIVDANWNTLDGGYIGVLYNVQQIYINKNDTVANIISWLNTINFEMYYVLATPTNTEITDSTLLSQLEAIYNANSKNGTTNINQENNDLPFIITASALEKEV